MIGRPVREPRTRPLPMILRAVEGGFGMGFSVFLLLATCYK
jgi:hypothetical protein